VLLQVADGDFEIIADHDIMLEKFNLLFYPSMDSWRHELTFKQGAINICN
jgi:hypothetical protein